MSTASTRSILNMIRTRLLNFVPAGDTALATIVGATDTGSGSDGKLFIDAAPDNLTGFWGIMRLIDAPQRGMDGGFMVRGIIEVILYGRPRKQASTVDRMADIVQQAWLDYRETEPTGNCLIARDVEARASIPYEAPADRDLVAVRMLLPFMTAPQFLTQYATNA